MLCYEGGDDVIHDEDDDPLIPGLSLSGTETECALRQPLPSAASHHNSSYDCVIDISVMISVY